MLQSLGTLALLSYAVVSDLKTRKIKNAVLLPFMLAGIAVNTVVYGIKGIESAIMGTLFPFVLLIGLYALGVLGGGDIKLLSTVGSIMGISFIIDAMLYVFIVGGILGLAILILQRSIKAKLHYFLLYIRSCFLTHAFMPYNDTNMPEQTKFRFSIPIALGVIFSLFLRSTWVI